MKNQNIMTVMGAAAVLLIGGVNSLAQVVNRCPSPAYPFLFNGQSLTTSEYGEGAPGAKSKYQNGNVVRNAGTAFAAAPRTVCRSLAAGDGFVRMADGWGLDANGQWTGSYPGQWTGTYMFGFQDVTNYDDKNGHGSAASILSKQNGGNWPAPPIIVEEDDNFFLNLTNVTMFKRPDLQDPHTVHFHGFPNASAIFDGLPESAIAVQDGSSLTYYYQVHDAGTYMYHCHVEAAEHMEMGMLGNLLVRPRQNLLPNTTFPSGFAHQTGNLYAYNDGDGSTYADIEYMIQLGGFDPNTHWADLTINHVNFAEERDVYPMLNGRGYPDTVNPAGFGGSTRLPQPGQTTATAYNKDANGIYGLPRPDVDLTGGGVPQFDWDNPFTGTKDTVLASPQQMSSLITVPQGKKALLRISNLNTTRFYTLGALGVTMQVVGYEARQMRGPGSNVLPNSLLTLGSSRANSDGKTLYYNTNSITLGGGESIDVIIDTTGLTGSGQNKTIGFLYTTNLDQLANRDDDFGGMMTEIRVQ